MSTGWVALREKAFCYVVQEYIVFSFVKKFTKYAYAYVIHKKAPPAQGGVAFIRMAPDMSSFLSSFPSQSLSLLHAH